MYPLYSILISACAAAKAVQIGEDVHKHIKLSNIPRDNIFVDGALIHMYHKCGNFQKALEVWQEMETTPSTALFDTLLQACARTNSLSMGKQLHDSIISSNTQQDGVLQSNLIKMYIECGDLSGAASCIIQIPEENLQADVLLSVIKLCTERRSLEIGKIVHNHIKKGLPKRTISVWNSLITMFAKCGEHGTAAELWQELPSSSITPSQVTYTCILKVWRVKLGRYPASSLTLLLRLALMESWWKSASKFTSTCNSKLSFHSLTTMLSLICITSVENRSVCGVCLIGTW